MRFERLLTAAVTLGVMAGLAPAVLAYDPKQDGKDFGKTVLIPKGKAVTQAVPNSDLPSYYNPNPSETGYFGDAPAMEATAGATKGSNESYQQMVASMASRPTFDQSELKATVAPGSEVLKDPAQYTSGMSINGTKGTCVELPPTVASPGFYEQACNTGLAPSQGTTQTCSTKVEITVGTAYVYHCNYPPVDSWNVVDSCEIMESCQTVAQLPGKCMQWSGSPPNQWCSEPGEPIEVRHCSAPIAGGKLKGTETVLISDVVNDSACAALAADSTCKLDSEVCSDATPATRSFDGLNLTKSCWGWQRTYTCGGQQQVLTDCSELQDMGCSYLREDCLTEDSPCTTIEEVWKCPLPPVDTGEKKFICDGDVYCIDGSCDTIEREANTEFKDAVVALNAIQQAGAEFNEDDWTIFTGSAESCTKLIFGIKNCCVPRGIPLFGGCNGADADLKTKREKGLCTYVGAWCSSKVLGICVEKKERHCCFASKISRIIQEQGRVQINKKWDSPKDEKCDGFTIEEFQTLDLSLMDFSEVYAEFVDAAKLPDELETLQDIKTKIEAYYGN